MPLSNNITGTDPANTLTVRLSDGTSFYTTGASGQLPAALGQATSAASLPVVLASDQATEGHLGAVGGNTAVVGFTLSLDTNAYAPGDLLADTQAVAGAVRVNAKTAVIQSIVLNDEDDQGQALDLVFLDANVTLGTENLAVAVSDANARNILGIISVAAADWKDLGGVRVATLTNVGLVVQGATASTSIYLAAISQGAGTYTASGITGRITLLQD